MATPVERYHYRVIRLNMQQQQQRDPMLADNFRFHISVFSLTTDSTLRTLLYRPSEYICCESFFLEGEDFLRARLSHPRFSTESLDHIIEGVIFDVADLLFDFDENPNPINPSESQEHEFRLDIIVDDVVEIQDFRITTPASQESIESLKKSKVTKHNYESCTICMEEFNINGDGDGTVEVLVMPCGHEFHQQCIVQWLQTSHVCPLCRYCLPTVND